MHSSIIISLDDWERMLHRMEILEAFVAITVAKAGGEVKLYKEESLDFIEANQNNKIIMILGGDVTTFKMEPVGPTPTHEASETLQ